ncbi:YqaJ viral recombinase family protein [Variovorax ginsengisoli]|uniref:YqaJ viral recombinase family protein n=1 Tax=Variovorax ginsengisoli TaxID=363844 RepID=A0ABT8SHJ4_9BURK|nr:YqaJ viral recombinase family protein [Variovorax ginsengisoli]MDN8617821.1 YqaJ viral recombinase family protein [Variovorax ginsengisoli]MDO1536991.1 YqaJ viral recombinase family protein [Variovorax ginsengisoli]
MKQQHDLLPGSDAWHQFRFEHDGASEAAAMLGVSRKVKRNELLRMKKTGIAKVFSDWVQENVLDYGHEVEALARPIIEEIFGVELYPATYSNGRISVSTDGIDVGEKLVMEHKQWNEALATRVRAGSVPLEHMPQCMQALMVTEADELVFVVSDGTRKNMVWCIVKPDPEWFERLRAGWAQFHKDLADYVPTEPVVEAIGRTPETLPALRIEVTGAVTASNLAQYREHALAVFAAINRDLKTDQDFANAAKTVQWCGDVESRLKAAKEHALSQTESIDQLFKTIDDITAEARKTRLELDKLVEARKIARKGEIVAGGVKALRDHVEALQQRTEGVMPYPSVDFGAAIKGLRTFDSMQNAVDTALANAKIAASATADRIQANLTTLREQAADLAFLFPDTQVIVQKAPDDLATLVKARIAEHKEKERAKEEAQRERIRKEEAAKAERKAREAVEAEDALIASLWSNARRIEGDSVQYIQKAIGMFESGAKDFENDPRPRVTAAVAEARAEMKAKLVAAQERDEAAAAAKPVEPAPVAAAPAAAPAATPAPAVIKMPARAAAAPAPATPPSLSLGQIGTRLGFALTADFVKTLGFEPAAKQRGAVLFHESQFPHLLAALIGHIEAVQSREAA